MPKLLSETIIPPLKQKYDDGLNLCFKRIVKYEHSYGADGFPLLPTGNLTIDLGTVTNDFYVGSLPLILGYFQVNNTSQSSDLGYTLNFSYKNQDGSGSTSLGSVDIAIEPRDSTKPYPLLKIFNVFSAVSSTNIIGKIMSMGISPINSHSSTVTLRAYKVDFVGHNQL